MAFYYIKNSTTALASSVNDNFKWIASGSRLPMGGDTCKYTDSAYDLGSAANQWKNIYADNIDINGVGLYGDSYGLVYETTLSSTASSLSVTYTFEPDKLYLFRGSIDIAGYASITSQTGEGWIQFSSTANATWTTNGGSGILPNANTGFMYAGQIDMFRLYWGPFATNETSTTILFDFEFTVRYFDPYIYVNGVGRAIGCHIRNATLSPSSINKSQLVISTASASSATIMTFNYLQSGSICFQPGSHFELWRIS